jgi:hypothetical protein
MGVTFQAEALRRYRIAVQSYLDGPSGAFILGYVYDGDGNQVGTWANLDPSTGGNTTFPVHATMIVTSASDGVLTYKLVLDSPSNFTIDVVSAPGRETTLVVEDIGTVPNPTVAPTWGGVKWGQTYWS